MAILTTTQEYKALKKTLENIITDSTDTKTLVGQYFTIGSMSDAYVEDAEYAGPTLLKEKPEGAPIEPGTILEGGTVRYTARTMAAALHVSEEAIEDCKYDKVINAAKRLAHSAAKTQDYDAANTIIRSTTAGYTGGTDGVILASASHLLPSSATWSNVASSYGGYATPSQQALVNARVAVGKYPEPNGLIGGNTIKKIICPLAQEAAWETIIRSDKKSGTADNDMNVAKTYKLQIVAIPYLDAASTTQWGIITDADLGLQWKWRVRPQNRTSVDNDCTVMKYFIRYREAHKWTDPRCWYQGNV